MTFCPIHKKEELRRENNYTTGFCSQCLQHYQLCCENQYMSICQKLLDHDGPHEAENGMIWEIVNGKAVVSYKKLKSK